jgi:hypothetical protein
VKYSVTPIKSNGVTMPITPDADDCTNELIDASKPLPISVKMPMMFPIASLI